MTITRPPTGNKSVFRYGVFLAILGISNFCHAQFAQQVAQDGAFAYFSMNDGAIGRANNSVDGSIDVGNYANAVEFGVPGLADANFTGIRVDGSGGRLNINDSSNINLGGPFSAKTIELWFSADDVNSDDEQVLYEQGGATRAMSMYIRDGQVFVGAHNSSVQGPGSWPGDTEASGDNDFLWVSTDIEDDTPYYLALVFDGDDDGLEGTISGYLNGELFGSEEGAGLLYEHTDDITLGGVRGTTTFDRSAGAGTSGACVHEDRRDDDLVCYGNDPDNPSNFSGVLDDVALYNVALTAEQIQAHYDAREYLAGDFNNSGAVDFDDFVVLSNNFNADGDYPMGDISFNGHIDLEDYSIFREILWENAAAATSSSAASVPEPSSSLLIMLAAFFPLMLRRARTR